MRNFLNFARPTELVLGDRPDLPRHLAIAARGHARRGRPRGGEVIVSGVFPNVLGDEVLLRQAFDDLCRDALEACVRDRDRTAAHRD